jgi:hypothetical protein
MAILMPAPGAVKMNHFAIKMNGEWGPREPISRPKLDATFLHFHFHFLEALTDPASSGLLQLPWPDNCSQLPGCSLHSIQDPNGAGIPIPK